MSECDQLLKPVLKALERSMTVGHQWSMVGNNVNKGLNSIYIVGHLKTSIVSQGHFKVRQGCPRLLYC